MPVDEKTLYEIARLALRRKARWSPPTLSHEDLLQEAVVAILGAERESAIALDPVELQRAAELHLVKVFRRETNRKEFPSIDLSGGRED